MGRWTDHSAARKQLHRALVAYMILVLGGQDIPAVVWGAFPSGYGAHRSQTIVMLLDSALTSSHSCLLIHSVPLESLLLFDYLDNIYDILIALVFGFSSLSVLGLAVTRAEQRRGLNFGEVLAVTAVVVSVGLWGWEMLQLFHIFPIKLRP